MTSKWRKSAHYDPCTSFVSAMGNFTRQLCSLLYSAGRLHHHIDRNALANSSFLFMMDGRWLKSRELFHVAKAYTTSLYDVYMIHVWRPPKFSTVICHLFESCYHNNFIFQNKSFVQKIMTVICTIFCFAQIMWICGCKSRGRWLKRTSKTVKYNKRK